MINLHNWFSFAHQQKYSLQIGYRYHLQTQANKPDK